MPRKPKAEGEYKDVCVVVSITRNQNNAIKREVIKQKLANLSNTYSVSSYVREAVEEKLARDNQGEVNADFQQERSNKWEQKY